MYILNDTNGGPQSRYTFHEGRYSVYAGSSCGIELKHYVLYTVSQKSKPSGFCHNFIKY